MSRAGWSSKHQQRTVDSIQNSIKRLDQKGRMEPVPLTNLAAKADIKTRGAQVTFKVTSLQGVDSFVLMRNFSRDPGSAQAIHTWPAAALKNTPQTFPIALTYADADQTIAGKTAYYWIKVVPLSTRTGSNIILSGPQKFDASQFPAAITITTDLAIGQSYTPTTKPLTSTTGGAPNQATISIAAFVVQYPFGQVSYSSGSITPLLDATDYFVYCNDPTYKGGAQTYIATTQNPEVTSATPRIYLGVITTPVFGGGGTGGFGGGGGPCFSANTRLHTLRGFVPISQILPGDTVMTRLGWRKVVKPIEHEYDGEMRSMGKEEFVTPGHRIWSAAKSEWIPAGEVFPKPIRFKGKVYNLALGEAKTDHSKCYLLANGWFAHNVVKK